ALAAASRITGFSPAGSPGEMALAATVALSIGQLWVALLRAPTGGRAMAWRAGGALGGTVVAALAAFALYRGAERFLHPVLGDPALPDGPLARVAAAIPVAVLAGLTAFQAI